MRELDDIMRDPQPDPARAFNDALDRLAERPIERAVRLASEGVGALAETLRSLMEMPKEPIHTRYGVIEKIERDFEIDPELHLLLDYRDNSCPDVLFHLRASFDTLDNFIDGEYMLGSYDFQSGVQSARNTKTGAWVAGKVPHIREYLVVGMKHITHGTYKVMFAHEDGWKAEAILTSDEAAGVFDKSVNWMYVWCLTYKVEDPNGKSIRNLSPESVRRNFNRNVGRRSTSRGLQP